jgi:hypothetical protein
MFYFIATLNLRVSSEETETLDVKRVSRYFDNLDGAYMAYQRDPKANAILATNMPWKFEQGTVHMCGAPTSEAILIESAN